MQKRLECTLGVPYRPFSACCELPALESIAVQNIKLTVPFSAVVTHWQHERPYYSSFMLPGQAKGLRTVYVLLALPVNRERQNYARLWRQLYPCHPFRG
jgi:hypothetical protein